MFRIIVVILVLFFSFFGVVNAVNPNTALSESDNIATQNFMIEVSDLTPGTGGFIQSNTKKTIDYTIGFILQRLMVIFGTLATLMMVVGAGFMILNSGKDELVSKGKTIFITSLASLVIALGAYFIVDIVAYIIY